MTNLKTTLEYIAGKVADLFVAPAVFIRLLDREHSQVRLLASYARFPLPDPLDEQVFDLADVPIFRQVADQNKSLVLAAHKPAR